MTSLQWIGLAFVVGLVTFMITTFFVAKDLTEDQRRTMKFLTSLCAGFAGGLFTGDALFRLTADWDAVDLLLTGTAGFASFFAWL